MKEWNWEKELQAFQKVLTKNFNLPDQFNRTIDFLQPVYKHYTGEDPEDLFVVMNPTTESWEMETFWFFSKNYAMKTNSFVKEEKSNMEFYCLPNSITSVHIKAEKYDPLLEADEHSTLITNFTIFPKQEIDMRAIKAYCDILKHIIAKHLIPNMKKG